MTDDEKKLYCKYHKTLINNIRRVVFNLVRKALWRDYNINEDFDCEYCSKQMFNRYLYCSNRCEELWALKHNLITEADRRPVA